MAILNLNEKKIPSAENLRLLSSLILSLSSKQGAIENKLINNWVASTAYIKDESFVIYDELLYVCKISNADDTFDKNKWTCLSPTISELTKADIEALVNLTPEQITNLQSLIDDTSISTTHTNSSSHIYMAIQDAITECKDDTLKQIAKKVSGSYKIANTTADIVSADYIYLLSNGSNYDLYVLVDGTATKVGDTNIDLSEYVKTTDLADYMKTSDADGKFATITTVEGTLGNLNAIVDTKLPMVTSLPTSPSNQETVLYIGNSSGGLKSGGIYQYQVSEWVLISYAKSFTFNEDDFNVDSSTDEVSLLPSRRVFNGSKADWDLLSVAEKTQYGATAFTDDEGDGMDSPVDVVQDGNMHAVTSNAVADFAFDKSKIRTGIVYGGSANNDNWVATFDTPFADSNYTVIATPLSSSGAPNCPNGWYVVSLSATGFSIYCNGNAPRNGFQYIAIHN